MRIFHELDPFLVRIRGEFGIRWYSLPYLLGFILAYRRLMRAADRREVPNLTREGVESFLMYLVVGVLVGARFFHVFVFEYAHYGFDPYRWIAVWRGGLSFHGGLLGVVGATWFFARRTGVSVYHITDRLAVPAAIALGFGRIANFVNAEMVGTLYDGPFCIDYSQNPHLAAPPAGCRHPTVLYEMAKNWAIAGFLTLQTRRWNPRPGVLTWTFIGLYGAIRFMLMYLRDEARVWGPLTLSQIFSGLMALAGATMLVVLLRGDERKEPAPRRRGRR
jgi:phosphatidylglycerol---prolipoprotein diacylglyceryl transferase